MWDLPGSGIKPVSPARAGRFFTTEPPGKHGLIYLIDAIPCILHNSVGKESACNAGDAVSIPGSGRSPGEGSGNPLQYSCLENPMDKGAWQASVHGVVRVGHDLVTKPPSQCILPHASACLLSHFSHVQLFVTPRTVACQAPLSMGFPRQEYWSELPFFSCIFSHISLTPIIMQLFSELIYRILHQHPLSFLLNFDLPLQSEIFSQKFTLKSSFHPKI